MPRLRREGNFVTEVSMDEVDQPQQPLDMLFILKALADLKEFPVQYYSPLNSPGRFNKGVDHEANPGTLWQSKFEEDILVIRYAVKMFGLPARDQS
ncbi:MAG: hypothetical protein U5L72_16130 [Bacteroidales bacterium]|nr:hypothetical protein [Bacteroidales bacterium]